MNETLARICRTVPLLLPILLSIACEDSTGPLGGQATEVAVVVNSTERSLTVVPVDDASGAFTIGIAPEGSPVTVAARGEVAVVPLGTYPFAAVVDLATRAVRFTVALPAGSGATGVAFLNDSIALVANTNLNSVTPVNVRRGTTSAAIPVGTYPQEIVAAGGRAYVINAQLENFSPVRPGTVTVIDGNLAVLGTVQLTGLNPGSAAFGSDGRLYIVNSGSFGASNGSLSVVNPATRVELSHHTGFGDFPAGVAATTGRVLVGLFGLGILEWNPASSSFTRGISNPLTPGDIPPVADIGFDSEGRLFALNPGFCDAPGAIYRIGAAGEVAMEAATGICPFGLAFTSLPE